MTALKQGLNGLVTIAKHGPRQAFRTAVAIAPTMLGDDLNPYFYGVPQLYKMPSNLALSQFKEDSAIKALPFIALGIIAIVGYNIWKPSR